jgi:hypothetical protein
MLKGREKEERLRKNESNQEKKKDRKESLNMKKMPSLLYSRNCSRYLKHDTNAQNAKRQTTKTIMRG